MGSSTIDPQSFVDQEFCGDSYMPQEWEALAGHTIVIADILRTCGVNRKIILAVIPNDSELLLEDNDLKLRAYLRVGSDFLFELFSVPAKGSLIVKDSKRGEVVVPILMILGPSLVLLILVMIGLFLGCLE